MTSILCEIAALYWSTSGTFALEAQNLYMYLLAPKCSAAARIAGQMLRTGALMMLDPEGTKSMYATPEIRDSRHLMVVSWQVK